MGVSEFLRQYIHMAQLKQRKVFFTPNLPDRPVTAGDIPLLAESLPAAQIQQLRDEIAKRKPQRRRRRDPAFQYSGAQSEKDQRCASGKRARSRRDEEGIHGMITFDSSASQVRS